MNSTRFLRIAPVPGLLPALGLSAIDMYLPASPATSASLQAAVS